RLPVDLPPRLPRLLRSCLSKSPAARPPSAVAVREEIDQAIEELRRRPATRGGAGTPQLHNLPGGETTFVRRRNELLHTRPARPPAGRARESTGHVDRSGRERKDAPGRRVRGAAALELPGRGPLRAARRDPRAGAGGAGGGVRGERRGGGETIARGLALRSLPR